MYVYVCVCVLKITGFSLGSNPGQVSRRQKTDKQEVDCYQWQNSLVYNLMHITLFYTFNVKSECTCYVLHDYIDYTYDYDYID